MPTLSLPRPQTLLAALVLAALPCLNTAQAALPEPWNGLPVGQMAVLDKPIRVTLAANRAHEKKVQEKYTALQANEGVLIVRNKGRQCFSTKDLPALSVAHLDDEDGAIVNIFDLAANDPKSGCSSITVSRTLIMPSGWFETNDISEGDRIEPVKAAMPALFEFGPPVGQVAVQDKNVLVVWAEEEHKSTSARKFAKLSGNEGVMEVYDKKGKRCAGTSGTPARSAAYLNDDGSIVNIADMERNTRGECSARGVRFVLHMPHRWFAENGVGVGDKVGSFTPISEQALENWSTGGAQAAPAPAPSSAPAPAPPTPPARPVAAAAQPAPVATRPTTQAVSAPANAAHWQPFPVGEMGIGQQTLLVHQIDSKHMAVMLNKADDRKAEAWAIKKVQTLLPNEGLLYVLDQDDKNAMKREDSLDAPRLELCIPRIPLYSLPPAMEGFAYSAAFLDEDGAIIQHVNTSDAQDADTGHYCARRPPASLLFMRAYWFDDRFDDIAPGQRVSAFKPVSPARRDAVLADWTALAAWQGLPVGQVQIRDKSLPVVEVASKVAKNRLAKLHEIVTTLPAHEGILFNLQDLIELLDKQPQYRLAQVAHIDANKKEICLDLPARAMAFFDRQGDIRLTANMVADRPACMSLNMVQRLIQDESRVLVMPVNWFQHYRVSPGDTVGRFKPITAARREQLAAAPWSQVPTASAAAAKDQGMFGNFELATGFGVQTASGLAGRVVGVTDGAPNPNSLRSLGNKRQTLEGGDYTITDLGRCGGLERSEATKPSHRIHVTSPVTVALTMSVAPEQQGDRRFGLSLYGSDIRACTDGTVPYYEGTGKTELTLDLLPGEYELYAHGVAGSRYDLTLTERPDLVTHLEMAAAPGMSPLRAVGITLDDSYRLSPAAQPHELTVTAPLLLELTAHLDRPPGVPGPSGIDRFENPLRITLQGEGKRYTVESVTHRQLAPSDGYWATDVATMTVPLAAGQYQIFVDNAQASVTPQPYVLQVRENTRIQRTHTVTVDQAFKYTAFEGVWAAAAQVSADARFKACNSNKNSKNEWLDTASPHRLTVTTPRMVHIAAGSNDLHTPHNGEPSLMLRSTAGEQRVFCERKDAQIDRHRAFRTWQGQGPSARQLEAFLVPGEYELYITHEHQGDRAPTTPYFYEVHITAP